MSFKEHIEDRTKQLNKLTNSFIHSFIYGDSYLLFICLNSFVIHFLEKKVLISISCGIVSILNGTYI